MTSFYPLAQSLVVVSWSRKFEEGGKRSLGWLTNATTLSGGFLKCCHLLLHHMQARLAVQKKVGRRVALASAQELPLSRGSTSTISSCVSPNNGADCLYFYPNFGRSMVEGGRPLGALPNAFPTLKSSFEPATVIRQNGRGNTGAGVQATRAMSMVTVEVSFLAQRGIFQHCSEPLSGFCGHSFVQFCPHDFAQLCVSAYFGRRFRGLQIGISVQCRHGQLSKLEQMQFIYGCFANAMPMVRVANCAKQKHTNRGCPSFPCNPITQFPQRPVPATLWCPVPNGPRNESGGHRT